MGVDRTTDGVTGNSVAQEKLSLRENFQGNSVVLINQATVSVQKFDELELVGNSVARDTAFENMTNLAESVNNR